MTTGPEDEERLRRVVRLNRLDHVLLEEAVLVAAVPPVAQRTRNALRRVRAVTLPSLAAIVESAGGPLHAAVHLLPQIHDGDVVEAPQGVVGLVTQARAGAIALGRTLDLLLEVARAVARQRVQRIAPRPTGATIRLPRHAEVATRAGVAGVARQFVDVRARSQAEFSAAARRTRAERRVNVAPVAVAMGCRGWAFQGAAQRAAMARKVEEGPQSRRAQGNEDLLTGLCSHLQPSTNNRWRGGSN